MKKLFILNMGFLLISCASEPNYKELEANSKQDQELACSKSASMAFSSSRNKSFWFKSDINGGWCQLGAMKNLPRPTTQLKILKITGVVGKDEDTLEETCGLRIELSDGKRSYIFPKVARLPEPDEFNHCLLSFDPRAKHKNWPQKWWKAIEENRFEVGMSPEAVRYLLGDPGKINHTGGAYGNHDQYVYEVAGYYLYFNDGKLTSWQDIP